MEIRKIASFGETETSVLVNAGKFLGNIATVLESGEATELSDDTKGLISALKEVIEKIEKNAVIR